MQKDTQYENKLFRDLQEKFKFKNYDIYLI